MNTYVESIFFNVLGGIIVSILTVIYIAVFHWIRSRHLQRLLGFQFNAETEVRITYGKFLLPVLHNSAGQVITHPFVKAPRRGGVIPSSGSFSMGHPVSECEVRASTYIATLLGLFGNLQPVLLSDVAADAIVDSNFISLGGVGSNYKTADTLAAEANIFVRMAYDRFSNLSGDTLPATGFGGGDLGIILRITPADFPARSWIVCAGLGEWGTSGSAWFLAHKWRELINKINPVAYRSGVMHIPDFLAFIRVVPGQDQSARLVDLYRNDRGQVKRIIMMDGGGKMFWRNLFFRRVVYTEVAIIIILYIKQVASWLINNFLWGIGVVILTVSLLIWCPDKLWKFLNKILGQHPVWCAIITGIVSGFVVSILLK